ncbi:MAG: ATP-binding cassette domain-containing protein [Acidimicrobiales bacterium]
MRATYRRPGCRRERTPPLPLPSGRARRPVARCCRPDRAVSRAGGRRPRHRAGRGRVAAGSNGAGKSSLLRVCAGLPPAQVGVPERCSARPRPRVGRAPRRRSARPRHRRSTTTSRFARTSTSGPRASRAWTERGRADLGVAGRLHGVRVGLLSAGQRRQVALAGVVIRRPQLWLLDEPHAGLDPARRDLVDRLVTDAAAARGDGGRRLPRGRSNARPRRDSPSWAAPSPGTSSMLADVLLVAARTCASSGGPR